MICSDYKRPIWFDLILARSLNKAEHITTGITAAGYFYKTSNNSLKTYSFELLQSRDVQERDGGEVQDQTVEINSGHYDVGGELSIPINVNGKVLEVRGQVQLLQVAVIPLFTDGSKWCVQEALLWRRKNSEQLYPSISSLRNTSVLRNDFLQLLGCCFGCEATVTKL